MESTKTFSGCTCTCTYDLYLQAAAGSVRFYVFFDWYGEKNERNFLSSRSREIPNCLDFGIYLQRSLNSSPRYRVAIADVLFVTMRGQQ